MVERARAIGKTVTRAVGRSKDQPLQALKLERGFFRTPAGKPVYLIGANFWPKLSGPWMYRDQWDPTAIGRDLAELAALGANCARIFCFTPDFMPTRDAVSEEALNRFEQLVALCAERGMWSLPTFLVGHMSGENFDPPWLDVDNWYESEYLLERQELLLRTIATHFKEDARIAAWIVTNEWPLYAGSTTDERGLAWAHRLCAALRGVDPRPAISLGDGAWDIVWGQQTGLPAPGLTGLIGFFGPHFYPKETDALRHSLVASFTMRMLAPFGLPVLLEEFGCSSDQADDEFAADYYRTTLWSAFGAGNCGALAWNSHDFPLPDRRPYSHHPYELHFGLIRADGSRKAQAEEFARFARFVDAHDLDEWEPILPTVAIARTSYFTKSFPFDWGWTKPELRDLYLQTYATCVKAGIDAGFVDLADDTWASTGQYNGLRPRLEHYTLILMPCVQQVTTGDAAGLEAFVRAGGVLYLSHGGEPWQDVSALTGVRPRMRYGLVQSAPRDALALRFVQPFGEYNAGDLIHIRIFGDRRRAAGLTCEPTDAETLAVDADGHSALFRNRVGSGAVFFCAYPLESYLMHAFDANDDDESWRLYRALLREFAPPPVVIDDPLVQVFSWKSKTQSRLRFIAVNHGWESVEATLAPGALEVVDLETGARVRGTDRLWLPRKGVRAFDVNTGA